MVTIHNIQKSKTKESVSSLEKVIALLNQDIKLFDSNLSDKNKQYFFYQLEILIQARIDIGTALKLMAEISTIKNGKLIFEDIYKKVISGSSLSGALMQTGYFSSYEIFSIQIGEETGRQEKVLKDISSFYTKKIKQRRSIINALTYPVLVLSVALGSVFFMLNVVVPMFAEVFKRFGTDLPFITRMIMGASHVMIGFFPFFSVILFSGIIFLYVNRKKDWYTKWSALLLLKIPIVGSLLLKIYTTRLCSSLSLLLESRVPVVKALRLVKEMVDFYPIVSTLDAIEHSILNGKSLHKSMQSFPVFEPKMIALIKVAEEVNKLDEMFHNMANQYSDDAEYQVSILNSLLEPVLIIFLGLVVGIILIGMYLPLFQLGINIK
jgi:type IV pilus assembly protein PilC